MVASLTKPDSPVVSWDEHIRWGRSWRKRRYSDIEFEEWRPMDQPTESAKDPEIIGGSFRSGGSPPVKRRSGLESPFNRTILLIFKATGPNLRLSGGTAFSAIFLGV